MGANASTPASSMQEPSTSLQTPSCPLDHKTRETWLKQRQYSHGTSAAGAEISNKSSGKLLRPLSTDREVSSIPRAFNPGSSTTTSGTPTLSASHTSPPNAESETGHDATTGNWIYPSERQFFNALVRKNNVPASGSDLATSVASIIPIHNAVNERAWAEILEWENHAPTSDPGSKKCGGPRLYSFRGLGGDSRFLSPRARINGWLGYQRPFDRHDWVVERCGGRRIEYVIDFYQGKSPGQRNQGSGLATGVKEGKLSFYLDVRPKLNSWEGWHMRFNQAFGL